MKFINMNYKVEFENELGIKPFIKVVKFEKK